jgi:hypothetical protein
MTPEEQAYEEALRRIRKAEKTGVLELDLSGLKERETGEQHSELATLKRLPRELANLTSLRSLNFDGSGSSGLISLQTLDLAGCNQLSGDLSPLAALASLQSLNLGGCKQLSDLSPLKGLTSLQVLSLVLSWIRSKARDGERSPIRVFTSTMSLR